MSGSGRKRFGFSLAAVVALFSLMMGAMLAPATTRADEAVDHPAHIHNGDCSAPGDVVAPLTNLVNSDEQVFNQYRHWAVGSLQGRDYAVFFPVLALASVGLAIALSLARALDTAALGADLAKALGGSPLRIWGLSALAVILLSGAATAAAGPIGFVGLTAPHIARLMTGPGHRWLLPYAMVLSAILTVGADALGRVIAPPGEVGVGIMVALMGGPFFIALVRRHRISRL